jgi:predicted CXXCH cytochrome family protein
MKRYAKLASAIIVIFFLLFLYNSLRLPALPPAGSRGACNICHWDKRDIAVHANVDFAGGSCLSCHNPHTHFGKPYLPSIDSCLICHFEYKAQPGYSVHQPVREKQCLSCHTQHKLFEESSLTMEPGMLCNMCHRDEALGMTDPVGHQPYTKKQCLSCHDPHMTPERALLRTPLQMLCQSCHRQDSELLLPVQHLPFMKGNCVECHLPHVSAWRGLTRHDQTTLCYSCHFDRKRELQRPVKHEPYGEGRCTDCHEPHSSVGKNLLPQEDLTEFCFDCHGRIHDLGYEGSPHAQLVKEKGCSTCHEHHSALYGYLSVRPLTGKGNLCINCHYTIGDSYLASAHGILACGECHNIHGSQYTALLANFELLVCGRCHPGLVHRETNHPVGLQYQDTLRNRPLLCSGCHSPHGTRYSKMKVRPGNQLCIPCHEFMR